MIGAPIMEGGQAVGVICHEPMEEIKREPDGAARWCFICRKKRLFDYVVIAPVEPSYYEPSPSVKCTVCHTDDGDLFPGRFREWVEE